VTGTVIAFDFGTQRIGVAVGETLLGQARPLTVIDAAANDERFSAITKLIAEWQPVRLLVGLPSRMDGAEHEMSARCRRFAHQLEGRYRLPVELIDERLSSADAEADLARRGMDWRTRKDHIDAAAAAILLQNFFDAPSIAPLATVKP
jgi:putative holliday junction resolvase